MSPEQQPANSTEEQLSIIDTLVLLPFLEREGRSEGGHGWGGPGYHIAVLRASQDFWESRSPETATAAEEELKSDLVALATVLTRRWGSSTTLDLWPYLGFDDPDYPNYEAPEPLNSLCSLGVEMQIWRVPSTGRWLGLTIGQGDRELPFELLAAVGEDSVLPQ